LVGRTLGDWNNKVLIIFARVLISTKMNTVHHNYNPTSSKRLFITDSPLSSSTSTSSGTLLKQDQDVEHDDSDIELIDLTKEDASTVINLTQDNNNKYNGLSVLHNNQTNNNNQHDNDDNDDGSKVVSDISNIEDEQNFNENDNIAISSDDGDDDDDAESVIDLNANNNYNQATITTTIDLIQDDDDNNQQQEVDNNNYDDHHHQDTFNDNASTYSYPEDNNNNITSTNNNKQNNAQIIQAQIQQWTNTTTQQLDELGKNKKIEHGVMTVSNGQQQQQPLVSMDINCTTIFGKSRDILSVHYLIQCSEFRIEFTRTQIVRILMMPMCSSSSLIRNTSSSSTSTTTSTTMQVVSRQKCGGMSTVLRYLESRFPVENINNVILPHALYTLLQECVAFMNQRCVLCFSPLDCTYNSRPTICHDRQCKDIVIGQGTGFNLWEHQVLRKQETLALFSLARASLDEMIAGKNIRYPNYAIPSSSSTTSTNQQVNTEQSGTAYLEDEHFYLGLHVEGHDAIIKSKLGHTAKERLGCFDRILFNRQQTPYEQQQQQQHQQNTYPLLSNVLGRNNLIASVTGNYDNSSSSNNNNNNNYASWVDQVLELATLDETKMVFIRWLLMDHATSICKIPHNITMSSLPSLEDAFIVIPPSDEMERKFQLRRKAGTKPLFLYTGTNKSRAFPIIKHGLKTLSGTKRMVHGSALGEGVYCTCLPITAASYSGNGGVIFLIEIIPDTKIVSRTSYLSRRIGANNTLLALDPPDLKFCCIPNDEDIRVRIAFTNVQAFTNYDPVRWNSCNLELDFGALVRMVIEG
jgi:hypothetical protein